MYSVFVEYTALASGCFTSNPVMTNKEATMISHTTEFQKNVGGAEHVAQIDNISSEDGFSPVEEKRLMSALPQLSTQFRVRLTV